ncbi:unnamed protein product [Ilex paraguariensis]|uniref:Uncharacterized protein n=1 Tax=Ilex paraguariensis TaxID=185542 RepID=A0ABC8UMJ9_9AQUA
MLVKTYCIQMANTIFSSFNLNESPVSYSSLKGYENDEIVSQGKEVPWFGMIGSGRVEFLGSTYGLVQENMAERRVHQFEDQRQQPDSDFLIQNDFHHYGWPLPVQTIHEATTKHEHAQNLNSELPESMRKNPYSYSLASSFELLGSCRSEFKKSEGESLSNICNEINRDRQKLSTEEIIRVAGERYIQFSTQRVDGLTMSIHPYGSPLSGFSLEDARDVGLADLLLDAAEKVGTQQFDRANELLTRCEWLASDSGNPVQRIVFYFGEALRERIDRETGRINTERAKNEQIRCKKTILLGTNPSFLACHKDLPFNQVVQFAGIQAITESVRMARKVHLIDLSIRGGVQWTALMQALAEQHNCPIELLKITAIGTTDKVKIEETGNRLLSFAKSLNLPLSFKVVFLSDMKDLKEDMIDIEADEIVAVYSPTILRTMISTPDSLEDIMGVIRRIKPSVMVVIEVEANHNSPSFVNRFTEALFFYSAYFDCLEECVELDDKHRMITEGIHLRDGIQETVAKEGEERFNRNVKMHV